MFKRIDHVEVSPSDFERTMAFYLDIFGFTLKERVPINMPPLREIAYLTLGDTMVELLGFIDPVAVPIQPAQVGYRSLALEVTSMDEAVAYLHGKGIAITWGPMDIGNAIRAEICDPDGLSIELRQWK